MNEFRTIKQTDKSRLAVKPIFRAATLALMLSLALPLMAAEARAVKLKVPPVYPEVAKRLRITGEVKVEAVVDAEGKVTDVKIVSGNAMLSSAANDAVRKWKFAPATEASTVELNFNFGATE